MYLETSFLNNRILTNAWEQRKLGEISEKVKEKNSDNLYSIVLTNSAEFGIIPQRDFFDKDIANEKSLNGYYIVKQDDFVYNPRISNHAPVGPIKRNQLNEVGVMSPLYYVFRTHDIENSYLATYFDTTYWHKFMKLNGDSGARADRFSIKDSLFIEMPIPCPTLPEQTAIGSFFQELDQLITLQQRELDLIKEGKKTLLSKMFPKDGENFPEIRFPGFTNAWEQRKLGEILSERNIQEVPTAQIPLVSFTVEHGVTPKTERYNREFLVREETKKYKYTKYNDIVYNPANLKFGAIARNKYGEAFFSPIYVTFEANYSNVLPEFIEKILTSNDFIQKALKFQEGTVYERMAVKADDFLKLVIKLPTLPEQTAIGSFFQELDQLITLQQHELEILKTMKSTLLKAMFA